MFFNFGFGRVLGGAATDWSRWHRRGILMTGVAVNLGLLGYFKYANFFVDNLNLVAGTTFHLETIILPLAISFFTFQQIAYLVDAFKGITKEYDFLHYALFVTFFPQLIAGPIVHHKEMLPQFMKKDDGSSHSSNLAVGLTIFFIGLFKKAVLADGVAVYASPVFATAASGESLDFFQAWGGALAYTMQLYFDFSGYSDMAIGASRMFGIKLPINFHSPYKATSISEFWRRWHITLSRFLRDYLYIPIGGNGHGRSRRYRNLIITMLLGGLWHGAGWTFVIWGGLHGFYLCVNHFWRFFKSQLNILNSPAGWVRRSCAWFLTFIAVVVGWVFFRATSLDAALIILDGMAGLNGLSIPNGIAARLGPLADVFANFGFVYTHGGGMTFVATWLWIATLIPIAIWFPNTQEFMARFDPATNLFPETIEKANLRTLSWAPNLLWSLYIAMLGVAGVLALSEISEFLYFQF